MVTKRSTNHETAERHDENEIYNYHSSAKNHYVCNDLQKQMS